VDETSLAELRLFLEELCCNLLRFQHVDDDGIDPEQVRIRQEVYLGAPGAFADIRISLPGRRPYFVEIKYGYPPDRLVRHLAHKYGSPGPAIFEAEKLVLVVAREADVDARVREVVSPDLAIEVWDERKLLSLVSERFGVETHSISPDSASDLRLSIDNAKGRYAFGREYTGDPQQSALLWHFGFWRLAQLSGSGRVPPREILRPGVYRNAAVLYADLSSFSAYVHDTREESVVRNALTSFYSKSRYQVLNTGGMLHQLLGTGRSRSSASPRVSPITSRGRSNAPRRCSRSEPR
jgi:hypothetical protein